MSDQGHSIGFNSDLVVGDTRFHVQTEVVGRAPARVVTNVMQGGRLAHSERHPFPAETDDLEQIRTSIERQHAAVVTRVTRGEIR